MNRKIDWPYEDMRRWYEDDGLTMQEIGDILGESPKMVWKVAKRKKWKTRRTGPKSGPGHPGWKGGRVMSKEYVLVYSPGHPHARPPRRVYVLEHRLVMEAILGRYLLPEEVVHHKNGNTLDNRPENLQLFRSNAEHLAETLKGNCPNWSKEGLSKIRQVWEGMKRGGAMYSTLCQARGDTEFPVSGDHSTG